MVRQSKYRFIVTEVKLDPCLFVSIRDIACRYNVKNDMVRRIIYRDLMDYFTIVGDIIVSKCALERMKHELRSVVAQISKNGKFYGTQSKIINKICGKPVLPVVYQRFFKELLQITFSDIAFYPRKISIKNVSHDKKLIPATLKIMLCSVNCKQRTDGVSKSF